MEVLDYLAGDVAGNWGAAGLDIFDGFQECLGWAGLYEVTIGSGAQGPEDAITVLVYGQHDDLKCRQEFLELSHTLNAGHARELDIHEHDIRLASGNFRQTFFARGKRPHTAHVSRRFKDLDELLAQPRVILDDGNFPGHKVHGPAHTIGR